MIKKISSLLLSLALIINISFAFNFDEILKEKEIKDPIIIMRCVDPDPDAP